MTENKITETAVKSCIFDEKRQAVRDEKIMPTGGAAPAVLLGVPLVTGATATGGVAHLLNKIHPRNPFELAIGMGVMVLSAGVAAKGVFAASDADTKRATDKVEANFDHTAAAEKCVAKIQARNDQYEAERAKMNAAFQAVARPN